MAKKKKRGSASRSPKKKAKATAKTKAKATAKTKAKVRAKAKPKAKATTKPKAKPKATTKPKAKTKAKAKAKAQRAPARAPAPVAAESTRPQILDEVIEQSLVDMSGILAVKDAVARSGRDVDEDELKQFSDPSLVIEVTRGAATVPKALQGTIFDTADDSDTGSDEPDDD